MASSNRGLGHTGVRGPVDPSNASPSPAPISPVSPPDSGNSSPNSPTFAQDVRIFSFVAYSVGL